MNDFYKQKAEENKVTGLGSFIDEMVYRWKSNPSLGGLPEKPSTSGHMFKSLKEFWNMPLMKVRLNKNFDTEFFPEKSPQ